MRVLTIALPAQADGFNILDFPAFGYATMQIFKPKFSSLLRYGWQVKHPVHQQIAGACTHEKPEDGIRLSHT